MHSMTQQDTLVVGGVDAHADTHHAAALDQQALDVERQADSIRIWCPLVIPGLLQVEEYIRAVYLLTGVDEDETDEKVASEIHYWTTPQKQCVDGSGDGCTAYQDWVDKWQQIKG